MTNTEDKPVEKVANIWARCSNPLRQLTTYDIERMLQNARYGDDIRLQVAFYEIERTSPIFSICISKRIAGVLNRHWKIVPDDDQPESKAQAEAVQRMFDQNDKLNRDGLTEALSHLCLSTFRGRAAVKPFVKDGRLLLKKLDNWNFLSYNGKDYWNPSSEPVFLIDNSLKNSWSQLEHLAQSKALDVIPDGEVVAVYDDKALDWAGISIFLRLMVGEDQWARAVEKFGIPQVLLEAPEGTPDTDLQKWDYRAQAIFEGASGVLPNGTVVNSLTAARGQDPFTEYISHQMQMFAILATGNTLATLGGAQGSTGAGMGSQIADVQQSQYNQLVSLDCKRIANAMQVAVDRCSRALGYETSRCRFDFVEDEDIDVASYLDYAAKLQSIGVTLDIQKLKDLVKLDFIKDDVGDIWLPKLDSELESKEAKGDDL